MTTDDDFTQPDEGVYVLDGHEIAREWPQEGCGDYCLNCQGPHVPPAAPIGTYPLPQPDDDPRFTFGLLYDIAQTLTAAGYPELTGLDLADLSTALFRFLYRPHEAQP